MAALVLAVSTSSPDGASVATAAPSCAARPVVDEFVAALAAGDVARLDEVFAEHADGWVWYFVNDRAGQRLGHASSRRETLRAYLAARVGQHEELRLLSYEEDGNGNFAFVLLRRADDLRGDRWVKRQGKGWVSCRTGKIGVWGLGGAPPPPTFGPCPRSLLPVARDDVDAASKAVLRFVREVYSEVVPSLDVGGARVRGAALAPGNVLGYTARVRCGREIQRRTIVVEVRFPRVPAGHPVGVGAFYVSRTRAGWLVWRLVRY